MTIVRSVTMLSLARDALERSANDADAAQAYLSERLLNDGYGGNAVLSGPFSTSIVALVADSDRNLPLMAAVLPNLIGGAGSSLQRFI